MGIFRPVIRHRKDSPIHNFWNSWHPFTVKLSNDIILLATISCKLFCLSDLCAGIYSIFCGSNGGHCTHVWLYNTQTNMFKVDLRKQEELKNLHSPILNSKLIHAKLLHLKLIHSKSIHLKFIQSKWIHSKLFLLSKENMIVGEALHLHISLLL